MPYRGLQYLIKRDTTRALIGVKPVRCCTSKLLLPDIIALCLTMRMGEELPKIS